MFLFFEQPSINRNIFQAICRGGWLFTCLPEIQANLNILQQSQ